MSDPETPITDDSKETLRTEAFSDGVFAIVVTLLALEIRVPSHETTEAAGGLLNALAENWPSYLAFTISFVTVLILWVNHHQLFKLFQRTDHFFRILNGLLLMMITLVPFSSALLTDYISQEENAKIAAMVYAGNFALIAAFWNILWFYGIRPGRLLDPKTPQELLDSISRAYLFSTPLYITATLLALIHVALSIGVVAGLAVFYGYLSPHRAHH